MVAGPAILLVPIGAFLLSRGSRSLAGSSATALLAWLNVWWVLPLLNVRRDLPPIMLYPNSTTVLVVGHLVAIALLLAAFGLFSPRPGSPTELAVRSARRGDHLAAGEFWLEAGRPNRAYRSFLRARNWARAADVARSGGRLRHAAELLKKEGGGSLGSAAQIFARLGDEGQAQQLWARYGQYLVENRQPELAIEPFLRAGDPRRAAHAVELALATQRFVPALVEPALRAARETKRPQLGGSVALAAGRFREAGDLFLAAGSPLDAARSFERAGESLRAAEALRQAGYTDEAARLRAQRLVGSGQLEEAAREYQHAGLLAEAAAALAQVGQHDEAFALYQQAGLLREAAELARDHRDPREAARLFSEIEDWEKLARLGSKLRNLERLHGATSVSETTNMRSRCWRTPACPVSGLNSSPRSGGWRMGSSPCSKRVTWKGRGVCCRRTVERFPALRTSWSRSPRGCRRAATRPGLLPPFSGR